MTPDNYYDKLGTEIVYTKAFCHGRGGDRRDSLADYVDLGKVNDLYYRQGKAEEVTVRV